MISIDSRIDKYGLTAAALAGLLYLSVPIFVIWPLAFNDSALLSFPPRTLSLRWFEKLLGSSEWMGALALSVKIGLMSTIIAVGFGLLMAVGLVRHNFPGKRAVYMLILLPLILPHIISATAFLLFFSSFPPVSSVVLIAIAHGICGLPLVVIIMSASLQGMNQQVEQAAMSLGASPTKAFLSVTLPQLKPAIISSCLFAFLASFDELLIALFLSDAGVQPVAVQIWKTVLYDLEPTIAAVSVVLIVLSTVAIVCSSYLNKFRKVPS